jgi:hypothetical protein
MILLYIVCDTEVKIKVKVTLEKASKVQRGVEV